MPIVSALKNKTFLIAKLVVGTILIAFMIASCGEIDNKMTTTDSDSTSVIDSLSDFDSSIVVKYNILTLTDSIKSQLQKKYTNDQLKLIGVLNRIDIQRLSKLDSIVVPDTFLSSTLDYSPFPKYVSLLDSVDLIILVSCPLQAIAIYQKGILTRWGPASTGKKTTLTPTGLFFTNWKSKRQVNTANSNWILDWYFNIENSSGVSFHKYELPGYPASHACIRLREEDAKWIYDNASQWKLNKTGDKIKQYGTPVIVFGKYPFSRTKPWYNLTSDSLAETLSIDSLSSVLKPFIPLIQQRQKERDTIK